MNQQVNTPASASPASPASAALAEPPWDDLELGVAELMPRIAPCQAATPVRFIDMAIVPAFSGNTWCDAFAQVNADKIARPFMLNPPPNRFVCLLYDRRRFREWGITDQQTFRRHFIATAIHEYGHALHMDYAGDHQRTAPDGEAVEDAARIAASNSTTFESLAPCERMTFFYLNARAHDHRFLRVALHLRHRAEIATGLRLTPGMVCSTTRYRSHPDTYGAALGDEPARLLGWSFASILASDPPAPFVELWKRDKADIERAIK